MGTVLGVQKRDAKNSIENVTYYVLRALDMATSATQL